MAGGDTKRHASSLWRAQLSRRTFLASVATAAAAAAAACDKSTSTKQALPTPSRRPNVVLFFPDQEAVTRIPSSLNRPNFQRIFDSLAADPAQTTVKQEMKDRVNVWLQKTKA